MIPHRYLLHVCQVITTKYFVNTLSCLVGNFVKHDLKAQPGTVVNEHRPKRLRLNTLSMKFPTLHWNITWGSK